MIKKIYLSLILITAAFLFAALPIHANDWGVFDNYESHIRNYATYKIVRHLPIKYYIEERLSPSQIELTADIAKQLENGLNKQQRLNELNVLVRKGFNLWPKETLAMIKAEGRLKEFKDIKPYISTPLNLQRVFKDESADITFIFSDKNYVKNFCDSKSAMGCFIEKRRQIFVISPPYKSKKCRRYFMDFSPRNRPLFGLVR